MPMMRCSNSSKPDVRPITLFWNWAEVGYQEEQSSARLQKELRDADFSVQARVVGMPTAFVAEYGSG